MRKHYQALLLLGIVSLFILVLAKVLLAPKNSEELFAAVKSGDKASVQKLLKEGANPNSKNKQY